MRVYEEKYEAANEKIAVDIKNFIDKQKESFETRERFKDATINYPTYGRGLFGHRIIKKDKDGKIIKEDRLPVQKDDQGNIIREADPRIIHQPDMFINTFMI